MTWVSLALFPSRVRIQYPHMVNSACRDEACNTTGTSFRTKGGCTSKDKVLRVKMVLGVRIEKEQGKVLVVSYWRKHGVRYWIKI